MRMRTSHKLKEQENIASMSLTIPVDYFQPHINGISPLQSIHVAYTCGFCINANLVHKDNKSCSLSPMCWPTCGPQFESGIFYAIVNYVYIHLSCLYI